MWIWIVSAIVLAAGLGLAGLSVLRLHRTRRLTAEVARLEGELADLRRETEHFRLAAEHANDGLVIQSMDGIVLWANPAYCRLMGYPLDRILGRNPLEYALPPEDRPPEERIAAFRYDAAAPESRELQLFRNVRADGTPFWNQINVAFRTSSSGIERAILVCRDITGQIEQEERLREIRDQLAHDASHDALTGLANRAELMRFTRAILADASATGRRVGMLHVDLDLFKEINDTHGHSAGDSALVHVARMLREGTRADDLVARVGGDEFVVVCPGIPDLDGLRDLAGTLGTLVARPFAWDERMLSCHASIGAALSGPGTCEPEDLLQRSDFALYEAKRAGRNRTAVYDEQLHQRQVERNRRAEELAEAVDLEALDHWFQPIVDLRTGHPCAVETLVRWTHPDDGIVAPDTFLPMALELGLMREIDLASMSAALRLKQRIDGSGLRGTGVSFNASTALMVHPHFVNRLIFGIEAAGIPREEVAIEVLETTVFGDPDDARSPAAVIRDLRDAGFQVLLDDFGVGYAGLAHLAHLAVTGVKIDRSLIREILTEETSAKIVASIIDLCHELGLRVIAEGVETAEIAARLQAMGCDRIQGYWIAAPMPADDVMAFLAGAEAPTAPTRRLA